MVDSIIDVYNELETWSACAGIHDQPDSIEETEDGFNKVTAGAATKARRNHYGFVTKGTEVPRRVFITNATEQGFQGTHKRMPSADTALQRVIYEAFQNSKKRSQTWDDTGWERTSKGSNLAFGTSNSPKTVLTKVAEQMYENQMVALAAVTPKNTDKTLKRKKKRSTAPLIDYGEMKAACSFWTEHDGEIVDA